MSLMGPYTLVYNMHIIICTCLILGVDFFRDRTTLEAPLVNYLRVD